MKKPDSIKMFLKRTASVLKIGIPSGMSGMMFSLSMMVTTSFVALIGDYALSAKVYFTTILSYVYGLIRLIMTYWKMLMISRN